MSQKTKDEDFSPGCSSVQQEGSDSPEPSCMSMKSDWSIDPPLYLKAGDKRQSVRSVQQKRSGREPSSVSMKSYWSIDPPPYLKDGDRQSVRRIMRPRPAVTEPVRKKMKYDESVNQPQDFDESIRGVTRH